MKKLYTLLLASMIFASMQSQIIDLSLKLEKGKEYTFNTQSKSSVSQNIMGQQIDVAFNVISDITYKIEDANRNEFKMKGHFDNLQLWIMTPQGEMQYSSETDDEHDKISSTLKAMKDKPFEVVMSKWGNVKDVNKLDSTWSSVIGNPENISKEQQKQAKEQMKESLGSKAIKNNLEMFTLIYPDKSLQKGDKWVINSELEGDIPGKVSTEYELIDYTKEYAIIKGLAVIEPDQGALPQSEIMVMDYNLSGKIISDIKVDRNTGWIINATLKREVSGDVNIKQSPEMKNGMKISIKVEQDILLSN